MKINKPNKSIVAGSVLLGLSAAAVYAAPKIKNMTNKMSNKMSMSNNNNNSMQ